MTAPLDIDTIHLDHGAHNDPDEGHCLMEVVSMFAKEPFTDQPQCVSPYLRGFGIGLNDRATDERRQDLRRFIPLVVGTAGDGLDEQRRWLAADHITRVVAPQWLDRTGLTEQAATLRALPSIKDRAGYDAAYPVVRAARDAAWKLRDNRLEPVREAVRRAVREHTADVAVAVAAAVAVAVAVDVAVAADAAAAVAAAAAAAADAAVAVAAAAAAAAGKRLWTIRNEVYNQVRAVLEQRYADLLAESWNDALDLYERLINPPAVSA